MKSGLTKVIFVLGLALSMPLGARAITALQDPPPASDSADKVEEKEEDLEPGKGKLSEFGEVLGQFWSVSSAVQGTQSFDDNVFMANNFRKSDTMSKLSGRITVAYRGQHTRFEASYMPQFNMYQRYKPLNYMTNTYYQTLRHDFSRRLTVNWNLSAHQAPSRGNLPFKMVNFGFFRYNMYSLEALQEGLTIFSGSNNLGLRYRWSPRLTVSANIDGTVSHFRERGNPTVSPVTNELVYSAGGRLGFEYTLNPRQTLGVTLGNSYLSSIKANPTSPSEHQMHQTARIEFRQTLPSQYSFHASVGPGVTERPGSEPRVSVVFDAGIARRLARSGFSIGVQRSTQVGLLQDSITGYGVSGRANRNFGRKWMTNIGGSYMRSEGASGIHQLESLSGHGQIAYRLSERLTPLLNYGYTQQRSLVALPGIRNVTRNEVAIGFVYNFGVIAGR